MKIPKQFNILGYTIDVVYEDDRLNERQLLGQASPNFAKISLRKQVEGKVLPKATLEHTYLHEVVHIVLKAMGEDELYENEKFVDLFAGLLHQILTTSK